VQPVRNDDVLLLEEEITMKGVAWLMAVVAGCASPRVPDTARTPPAPGVSDVAVRAVADLAARRSELGFTADHAFVVRHAHTDELGQRHVRVTQRYRGIRVLRGTAILHVGAAGEQLGMDDRLDRDVKLDVQPKLDKDAAVAVAARELAAPFAATPRVELVIAPTRQRIVHAPAGEHADPRLRVNASDVEWRTTGHRLAYEVRVLSKQPRREVAYVIDAETGDVLSKKRSDAHYNGRGLARTLYSDNVPINTTGPGRVKEWQLLDPTRGRGPQNNVNDEGLDDEIIEDHDNDWGDNKALDAKPNPKNRETAGADAMHGVQVVFDMLKRCYHWNGIDDEGTGVTVHVHDPNPDLVDDAEYSGWDGELHFGEPGPHAHGRGPLSIDIVAHEYGHAVNGETAGLSGGLNEGNSDIIGVLAKIYFRTGGWAAESSSVPSTTDSDLFIHGYDVNKGGRAMFDPLTPYWFDGIDDLEVHDALGPLARAFYFLSQGAKPNVGSKTWSSLLPWGMTGIGIHKAGRIWMRALTVYLGDDDWGDVRVAAVRAAGDLFGSNSVEQVAVRNAFAGVNIGPRSGSYGDVPKTVMEDTAKPHDNDQTAQHVSFPSATPVPGLHKVTVLGMLPPPDRDVYAVQVKCGQVLTARLESGLAANELVVKDSTGDVVASQTGDITRDDICTVDRRGTCDASDAHSKFFVQVRNGSQTGLMYQLHLDLLD
jgi:Zn-dependent metalloprotease